MSGALGPGVFIAGAGELGLTLLCAATASWLVVRHAFDDLRGAPRAVALALLTMAAMLTVELVPLTLGILTRVTVPITAVALLAGVSAVVRRRSPRAAPGVGAAARTESDVRAGAAGWLGPIQPTMAFAAVALVATAVAWLTYLQVADTFPVVSVDALGFHFPGVIRFIQSGSLWQTTAYLPGQAQANYPQNGDILMLAAALPWHSLAFVRNIEAPLLGLAGLASYATARELGAAASTAVVAPLALLAIHPVIDPALGEVLADATFLAAFSAGLLFLVRHHRTGRRRELALAGIGLGIALGTKWYGLTDVPLVLIVWAALALRAHGSGTSLARDAGVLVLAIACAGGIWLVRNLILTGNPVFDYKVSLFGLTIFAAPPDIDRATLGFTLAHYFGDTSVIRNYIWPVFRADFGLTGGLIVVGALAGAAGAIRRRPDLDRRLVLLAISALLVAIAYTLTPYSAQGLAGAPLQIKANTRYAIPALLLAVPALAVVASRRSWLRWPVEAVLLVCLLHNLHLYVPTDAKRVLITGVVVVLVSAGLWRLYTRPAPRHELAGALAAVIVAGLLGSYHYQRVLARRPYYPVDATINLVVDHVPPGTRIGLTGIWTSQGIVPVAPLFGERMQNTVEYVGPIEDHRLGVFTDEHRFLASLNRGRFPLLEVGLGFDPGVTPRQVRWAKADGYRVIAASDRLVLMGTAHVS